MIRILTIAPDEEIYDFLRTTNHSVEELLGYSRALDYLAVHITPKQDYIVDNCGTGGSIKKTANISTASAIIASAAGIPIAKHGNYAFSSKTGSADVLEELGYKTKMTLEGYENILNDTNFTFLLAPVFHPTMQRVAQIRRQIRQKTIFNLLGPLCNPTHPQGQVIGIYDGNMLETFAEVLLAKGLERALVVHGDGLDELTTNGPNIIYEINRGKIISYILHPEELGLKQEPTVANSVTPKESADLIRGVLNGEQNQVTNTILLNAGAVIYIGKRARDIEDGIQVAREIIDSGKAKNKLDEIVIKSNEQR